MDSSPPRDAAGGGAGRGFVLEASAFEEDLLGANRLAAAGFRAWDFAPGMRFGETAAWWRGGGVRAAPHEGLDLCRYRDAAGRLLLLGAGALVPAPWRGEVLAVAGDFIGATVFLGHDRFDGAGRRLVSACGHLIPRAGLAPGLALAEGEIVGALADPERRGRAVPPHLHLTIALVPAGTPAGDLGWELLGDRERVVLLDPAALLGAGA